jgi:ferredoxin
VKWINIILSVYLIVLSSLPCADTLVNDTKTHTTVVAAKTDNQSHEKDSDLCPPFCSCNCCAVQVLNAAPVITWTFNEETTLIKKPLSSYHSILTSNFYGSIWQPPQLV